MLEAIGAAKEELGLPPSIVAGFQGTAEDVLQNRELMAELIPTLRADFKLHETYQFKPEPPLTCPIVAYGGDGDVDVPSLYLEAWRAHTEGAFSVHFFRGGHFFLRQTPEVVAAALTRHLRPITTPRPAMKKSG